MRIAVDAMGGDRGPSEILNGVIAACKTQGVEPILYGDEGILREELSRTLLKHKFEIVHAPQTVGMGEDSSAALKKKDSAVMRAMTHLAEKKVDAFVSAGNSGTTMAAAVHLLGTIGNIKRPALAAEFPHRNGVGLFLDIGANIDCDSLNLTEFAMLGVAYARGIMGKSDPQVALLSNGTEEIKGNRAVHEAHKILKDLLKNSYCGFLEGTDFFSGPADIIVCDGFIGNIMLKFAEGLYRSIAEKMAGAHNVEVAKELLKGYDPAAQGGAPLLGVNGICVVCHGASSSNAIRNAILRTKSYSDKNFLGNLTSEVTRLRG